jgi:hypothetical protein
MQNNYEESLKAAADRAAQEQFKEDDERGLQEVYATFTSLVKNEATNGILRAYCGSNPVSLDVITYGFSSPDSGLVEQVQFVSDAEARAAFIEKLVSLSGGSYASQAFQRKQLSARVGKGYQTIYSTADLAEKAREKEKQVALRNLKPDEVTKLTQTSTDPFLVGAAIAEQNAQKQGMRLIGGQYFPPIPPEITRKAIIQASSAQQREWNRKFSAEQVGERFKGTI